MARHIMCLLVAGQYTCVQACIQRRRAQQWAWRWPPRCCLAGLLGVIPRPGSAVRARSRALALPQPRVVRQMAYPGGARGVVQFVVSGHSQVMSCHVMAMPGVRTACLCRMVGGFSPPPTALPSAWHPRQPWVAAAHASGAVHILDISLGLPSAARPAGQPRRCEFLTNAARTVLTHGSQRGGVYAAAWCPTSPGQLALGVVGGVNVWNVAGEARPPLPGGRVGGPWLRRLHLASPDAP